MVNLTTSRAVLKGITWGRQQAKSSNFRAYLFVNLSFASLRMLTSFSVSLQSCRSCFISWCRDDSCLPLLCKRNNNYTDLSSSGAFRTITDNSVNFELSKQLSTLYVRKQTCNDTFRTSSSLSFAFNFSCS